MFESMQQEIDAVVDELSPQLGQIGILAVAIGLGLAILFFMGA